MSDLKLFLALPTYNGTRHNGIEVANALIWIQPFRAVVFQESFSSILTLTFNMLWAAALNARLEDGITHFLMLHSDVCPLSPTWVSDFYGVMDRVHAPVLSAVVPIKDKSGSTSTAVDGKDVWSGRRFSFAEISAMQPTFSRPDLLVNTGLLLVDFRQPWVERVHFAFNDAIVQQESGRYAAVCESEDWLFSRTIRSLGVPLWATSEIPLRHMGTRAWESPRSSLDPGPVIDVMG